MADIAHDRSVFETCYPDRIRCRIVVTRYDTNGDGEISLDEYNAAIPDLGTTLTVADLIKLRAAYVASAR